jgi:hypothetical protein
VPPKEPIKIFLAELWEVLDVGRPEPTKPDEDENAYVLEKAVTFQPGDGTSITGRIDLYKRGCFVLEAKQGSDQNNQPQPELTTRTRLTRRRVTAVRGTEGWNEAMMGARARAGQGKPWPARQLRTCSAQKRSPHWRDSWRNVHPGTYISEYRW